MDKSGISYSKNKNNTYCPHLLNLYPNTLLSKFNIYNNSNNTNHVFNLSILSNPFLSHKYFTYSQCNNILSEYCLNHISYDWTAINPQQSLNPNSIVKNGCIFSLAFDDMGEHMASSNHNNTIEIWDIKKRKINKIITDHKEIVTEIVYFHNNNQKFLSCSLDKTIKLFSQYKCVHTFTEHSDWVRSLNISKSNKFFLSGCVSSVVKLWDIQKRMVIGSFRNSEHSSESLLTINSLEFFNDDENKFLVGLRDGYIKICDARTKSIAVTKQFKAHNNKLNSVKFNSQNMFLLSSGRDSCLKLWDIRKLPDSNDADENSKQCIKEYRGHRCNGYNVLCNFYNKERYILTGSEDGAIYIYDTSTAKIKRKIQTNQKCVILVHPIPNSLDIAFTGLEDVSIFIWGVKKEIRKNIERKVSEEIENNDDNIEKENEYYAFCNRIVEEIMNEWSDVIFKIFHENNMPFSKDINFGNLLEIIQHNRSPESEKILHLVNEKIFKSLTENLTKLTVEGNGLISSPFQKKTNTEIINNIINEVKCIKCEKKEINNIEKEIAIKDKSLLQFPNTKNSNFNNISQHKKI